MTSKLKTVFVHTYIDDKLTLAGRLDDKGEQGEFVYGKSYLENPKAYPLDPLNLPLKGEVFKTKKTKLNGGLPSSILDASPDSWGRRILMLHSDMKPREPLEFLLAANGGGVGSLRFSVDKDEVVERKEHNHLGDLANIQRAIQDVENDRTALPENLRQMLLDGSSMGGARPKATVEIEGRLWLAKFNRSDDVINQAQLEYASSLLAKDAGINTSNYRLESVGGKDVLLVERFDRTVENTPKHYLSARSLFPSRVNPALIGTDSPYSYMSLSNIITKITETPEKDRLELFKRATLNVLVSNVDDHAQNHGFLLNPTERFYKLSPSFDIVPQLNNIGIHSMHIGELGREGTLKNLLSSAKYYGITDDAAKGIVYDTQQVVKNWRDYARKAGLSSGEMGMIQNSFLFEREYKNKYTQVNNERTL